jgi:hypothetical protein
MNFDIALPLLEWGESLNSDINCYLLSIPLCHPLDERGYPPHNLILTPEVIPEEGLPMNQPQKEILRSHHYKNRIE